MELAYQYTDTMVKYIKETEKGSGKYMCRINPKVDFAFKKLFGSEENKDLLISFINSVLPDEEQIENIELKNPYNLANYRNGKMSILDIKAVDSKGVWYDIEMQIAEQGEYDKRAFYYWSKVYSDQLESGEDFSDLKKTIGINILDFDFLEEEDFHNVYKVYNLKSKKLLSDIFEMHYIELTKFKKDFKELRTALDRWIVFLNHAYELSIENIPEELAKDENVKKAIAKLDLMYLNKDEREFYENELKAMRIHKSELKTAKAEGRAEGFAEGEKLRAINIAKNLLDVLAIETIAIKTGLSVEEVKELKS